MVFNPITCCSVMRWASTPRGMKCPQHKKTEGAFRPLERGLEEEKLSDQTHVPYYSELIFSRILRGVSLSLPKQVSVICALKECPDKENRMPRLRFVHAADLHLDSPFHGLRSVHP